MTRGHASDEKKEYERVAAIDYGTKRIGLAVTDPFRLFAQPVGTFNEEEVTHRLEVLIECDFVNEVVVGYPVHADGTKSETTKAVDAFISRLQKKFPAVSITTIDERNSSRQAMQNLIASGMRKKKRGEKGALDAAAACVILQEYLEQRK